MNEDDAKRREALISGLRMAADWFERNPQVQAPHCDTSITLFPSRAEIIRIAREHGPWDKGYAGTWFSLHKKFGSVLIDVTISREQVCEKVKTGTKIVPAQPAQPEREVEEFEWRCFPLLAGDPEKGVIVKEQEFVDDIPF